VAEGPRFTSLKRAAFGPLSAEYIRLL